MADPLHQIVYISRATTPLDDAAAADLHRVAAERNAQQGITGLLLHDGTRFIQAIEGSAPALHALMARIGRDPRHYAIGCVSDAPIAARQFGDWAMDYRRIDDQPAAAAFLATVKRALAGVAASNGRTLPPERP
ncbi:BLUF domain-containing protein [Sphingomonas sp. DT-51]|uniref:BLUF domain-containing protein n=1 Tax=Sphingomonas sp. DT-51 TaxID=3396165 RepID=UPI003F1BAB86